MALSPTTSKPPKSARSFLPLVATGCIALALGGALSFVYFQFQARDAKLAEMAQLIEDLRQTQETEIVARAETAGMLAVDTNAVPAAVMNAASPQTILPKAILPKAGPTKADVLQSLVSQAVMNRPQAQMNFTDPGAFRSLATAIEAVTELSVVAGGGGYTLIAREDPADTPRIVFPDHIEKQAQLESILAAAAVDGFISYTRAAQRADGSVDGGIILLDLIKESL